MKAKRSIVLALQVAMAFAALGQATGQDGSLQLLFRQAVSAEGRAYFDLRDEIVGRGRAAIEFLQDQQTNANLRSRIAGAAIVSWITEQDTNQLRSKVLSELLREALRHQAGMPRSVQAIAFGNWGSLNSPVSRGDPLDQKAAEPFLLEAALKGLRPTSSEANPSLTLAQRCLAAALVGSQPGSDVVPLLGELLRSKSYELRACAATGLQRAKSFEGTELLISALSDESSEVRHTTRAALADLTDQDFGEDKAKYLEWWQHNKRSWPFNDRPPGHYPHLVK